MRLIRKISQTNIITFIKLTCNSSGFHRTVFLPKKLKISPRFLHTGCSLTQSKSQYEYDPETDSFRPKTQISFASDNAQSQHKDWKSFLKKFLQNLFLITGGIVWVGALCVSLFVDVKETELNHIHDFEDEVRLLAFYDVGQSKNDLARIISKDKHLSFVQDIHTSTSNKQEAFLHVVKWIQNQDEIVNVLGEPVHLCGFRAASKINTMIKSFQHLAEHGIKEHLKDDSFKNTWKAECILEGTKALALGILEFERNDVDSEWVPVQLKLIMLQPSMNPLLDKRDTLPNGIILRDR